MTGRASRLSARDSRLSGYSQISAISALRRGGRVSTTSDRGGGGGLVGWTFGAEDQQPQTKARLRPSLFDDAISSIWDEEEDSDEDVGSYISSEDTGSVYTIAAASDTGRQRQRLEVERANVDWRARQEGARG